MATKAKALADHNASPHTVVLAIKQRQENAIQMALPSVKNLPDPQHVFLADFAVAHEFLGNPELVFVQLDRFEPNRAVRALSVRYEPRNFRARPEANAEFANGTVAAAEAMELYPPNPASHELWAACTQQSNNGTQPRQSMALDADFELAFRTEQAGSIVFLQLDARSRHQLLSDKDAHSVVANCPLEVTLPLARFAELLVDWDRLMREAKS